VRGRPPPGFSNYFKHCVSLVVFERCAATLPGKRTVPSDNSPLGHSPLPCSVRVRIRSGVSRVRVGIRVRVRARVRFKFWLGWRCPGKEMSDTRIRVFAKTNRTGTRLFAVFSSNFESERMRDYLIQPPGCHTPISYYIDSNKAGLKCPSVRPSVRSQKFLLFDFNEIWYVGRGRRVMHDGMQYDPIQGQGQGHEPFTVGNSAIFKGYLFPHL